MVDCHMHKSIVCAMQLARCVLAIIGCRNMETFEDKLTEVYLQGDAEQLEVSDV